jgi:hypothetical protein
VPVREPLNDELMRKYVNEIVRRARDNQARATTYLEELERERKPARNLSVIRAQTIYQQLTEPYGQERLEGQVLDYLKKLVREGCAELGISDVRCGA